MKELAGKVAVITGAASGIGRALADAFGAQGMKLVLADIERDPLGVAEKELRARGVQAFGVPTDVSDASSMDALGARALDRFGAVHVICNNAGVAGGGSMWELSAQDWDFVLGPNLWGVIHGVRVFARHLVAQNEGHIVNTASLAGLVSPPWLGPYNASKHAVVALSETLHAELRAASSAVGVSVLCPGFVDTRIFDSERHRARERGAASPAPAQAQALWSQLRASGTLFLDAAEVAQRALEAVRSGRFYVLTHEGTQQQVRERMQGILEGGDPPALSAASLRAAGS